MCTLSLFRSAKGYRVFMNRDERRARPAELSPQIICPHNQIFGPLDPLSGGTWIAYNGRGFWGCLLNGYLEEQGKGNPPKQSRGGILPHILRQENPLAAAAELNAGPYASFRLIVGSHSEHRLFVWNGELYSPRAFQSDRSDSAFFISSSSWEQRAVIERRKALFENWIDKRGEDGLNSSSILNVPSYHYSRLPAPESAPLMQRDASRTQSITGLDVSAGHIDMSYWRIPETLPEDLSVLVSRDEEQKVSLKGAKSFLNVSSPEIRVSGLGIVAE